MKNHFLDVICNSYNLIPFCISRLHLSKICGSGSIPKAFVRSLSPNASARTDQ
ncbi:hypothetical protein [Flavobacterium covae]|uniref:hypothetical protein n=1 Tax=Flavobacterium covae TaxID=2906076 RepID=UPI001FB70B70|nr:hypothetical protein [Flavobacterium covae]MCJ1810485.1 hypothetical protein [Flavobacterium covae]